MGCGVLCRRVGSGCPVRAAAGVRQNVHRSPECCSSCPGFRHATLDSLLSRCSRIQSDRSIQRKVERSGRCGLGNAAAFKCDHHAEHRLRSRRNSFETRCRTLVGTSGHLSVLRLPGYRSRVSAPRPERPSSQSTANSVVRHEAIVSQRSRWIRNLLPVVRLNEFLKERP
jgi:hypothetical protein